MSFYKAIVMLTIGVGFAAIASLEVMSQLPSGSESPVQVPLLTTPQVISLSKEDRKKLLLGEVPVGTRRLLVGVAEHRLANEPLDPTAIWLLSLQRDRLEIQKALELASRISRRESIVELELMRLYALSGDIKSSLVHLDNALLVSTSAALPVLQEFATALDEPQLVGLLKPYELRPWYKDLLVQAVKYAPRPENAADLLLQGDLSIADLPPKFLGTVILQLLLKGNPGVAERLAERFAGMDRPAMREFSPSLKTMLPEAAPLSWEFSDESNVISERIAGGISSEIEPSGGGILMTRITNFPPGEYTLRETVRATLPEIEVKWVLQCLTDGTFQVEWSERFVTEAQNPTYKSQVNITKNCVTQRWELVAFNHSGTSRGAVALTNLRLTP